MKQNLTPVGYKELVRRYKLEVLPHWKESYISSKQIRHSYIEDGRTMEVYSPRYDPGTGLGEQLTFALKYDGTNLEILAAIFKSVSPEEITDFVKSKPTGKYARIIWFLYEWLTGDRLPIDDLNQGNYVPVLDAGLYFTITGEFAARSKRHRVLNNLTGTAAYCPVVRRSELLRKFGKLKLERKAQQIIRKYPEELLYRATQYLYTKETKSSFEIEREYSDKRRTARFVELLRTTASSDAFSRDELVALQKAIVDERFALDDFRNSQNYVGQAIGPTRELIHYAAPRPEDIPRLMEGWMSCAKMMLASDIDAVVAAAVVGYGFVFLHPFEDGNGRLHRYLIHHVLAVRQYTPPGLIFPVSATMLKQLPKYNESLEVYSRELMKYIDYRLDDEGQMTVMNETSLYYRYPDLTYQAERLYEFVNDTIDIELRAELEFLEIFEQSRRKIREIVDLPDRKLDLFIRLCIEGKGNISGRKRKQFDYLTDEEFEEMKEKVAAEIARSKSQS